MFNGLPTIKKKFHSGLSVGRMVHFVDAHGMCLAATVSRVLDKENGEVSLHVCNPNGTNVETMVHYNADSLPFTWHWPEFVE